MLAINVCSVCVCVCVCADNNIVHSEVQSLYYQVVNHLNTRVNRLNFDSPSGGVQDLSLAAIACADCKATA